MTTYKEHDSVIFTDADGNLIDTFVIYQTDQQTGLTHINHQNLFVPLNALTLHPKMVQGNHLPIGDIFSFEIFKKLKAKYTDQDASIKAPVINRPALTVYSQAS